MSSALSVLPKNEKLVVQDAGPASYLFDTARFEHCYRIAVQMSRTSLLPDHLVINNKTKQPLDPDQIAANCFMILNQALRWQIDPFALPAETYVVANKLGFQGKLVAAVINARAGLARPLGVLYGSGKGDDLAAVIFGSESAIPKECRENLKKYCESEDRSALNELTLDGVLAIRITVGQAKTDNTMWKKDPEQKLFYTGATKWARRHRPEIMLGVLTDEDLERIRVTTESLGSTRFEDLTARLTAPASESAIEPVEGAWETFVVELAATDTEEAAAAVREDWFADETKFAFTPEQNAESTRLLDVRLADIRKRLASEAARNGTDDNWQTFTSALDLAENVRDADAVGDHWVGKFTPVQNTEALRLVAARKETIKSTRGAGSNKQKTMAEMGTA